MQSASRRWHHWCDLGGSGTAPDLGLAPKPRGDVSVYFPSSDTAPPSKGLIRVLTLNLRGLGGDWTDRRSALITGLRDLQPDLVAFQDVVKTKDYDQSADLLGPDYHVIHQSGRATNGSGVSIGSRWPVETMHQLDLRVSERVQPDFPCTTLVTEILAPHPIGVLLFVNKRTSWQLDYEVERELEAVAAARFITECVNQRGLHVVLAGDFNADPDAASVRFWTGRQSLSSISVCYRDAWESVHPSEPGHTFSPRNPLVADWDWPFRQIDRILVRCGEHGGPTLAIAARELAFDQPINGVWASDHFGVVADLMVPPGSSG
ncbi:MAG: endonuclease/exonuclease/phosphatase family protein [Chloroflexota bacterium]|nr:endonuclease/exonuclease/phosphatase family protein [Chloroflexota bacterium]